MNVWLFGVGISIVSFSVAPKLVACGWPVCGLWVDDFVGGRWVADFVGNLFWDVDHKAPSPSRFPLHWSITTDSTEVSEFMSLVFWLQLRLLNANHVLISCFKEIC